MSNFLSALQSIAPTNVVPKSTIKPKVLPVAAPVPEPLEVMVDRVLGRNRIDVSFNRKPEDEILNWLKDRGFRYNPESRAWYQKDCETIREIIAGKFGVSFEEVMFEGKDDEEETAVMPETLETVSGSPEYLRYKEQVNQLIERLEIDPADLMLAAIDCLYRKTFEN